MAAVSESQSSSDGRSTSSGRLGGRGLAASVPVTIVGLSSCKARSATLVLLQGGG